MKKKKPMQFISLNDVKYKVKSCSWNDDECELCELKDYCDDRFDDNTLFFLCADYIGVNHYFVRMENGK